MSIEITQVFARTNTSIPWFTDTLPESHFEYYRTNYISTGKMQGSRVESPDGLMLTVSFVLVDEAAFEEFISDSYLSGKVRERNLYNEEHGIVQIV
jgi:hypothetical protein